ncbi:MAG TPA: hypothetical protein DCL29_02235 [Eubacterium sp.]|nr:hypothetical protein [Eubacterium sp.]
MNLVDDVIQIALNEVGYLEKKSNKDLDSKTANAGYNNYTKYGRDMHKLYPLVMDFPAAWCDCFVDWCFYKAYGISNAKSLLGGDFNDYTVASANLYKNKNAWYTSNPKKGDQIFFKNLTGICHTGLVYNVDKDYVYTVEGNTSSASGVVSNGGAVCKKKYKLNNSRIAGYGRPKYDTAVEEGWKQDDNGWWYQYKDGSYPKSCWKTIEGKDYYFNDEGYILTDQYIKGNQDKLYYVDDKGAWNNNTYSWKQNTKGWWLEDIKSGWYPKSQWALIDNKWYYFKSDGYMAVNETIDGYYLNEKGVYDKGKKQSSYKVKVTANALNVRAAASKNAKVNKVIYKNTICTVTQTNNGWGYIGSGWIMLQFTNNI